MDAWRCRTDAVNLTTETPRPSLLVGEEVDIEAIFAEAVRSDLGSWTFFGTVYVVFLNAFQGTYEDGARASLRANYDLSSVRSYHSAPPSHFYSAICLLQASHSVSREDREVFLAKAEDFADRVSRWASLCAENFAHRHALLTAELARVRGDAPAAADAYDEAIALAQKNHFVQDEALANELCGRYWLGRGKKTVARAYLAEARRLYGAWGAPVAMQRLDCEFPDVAPREAEDSPPMSVAMPVPVATSLDIGSVLKASQAISGEIVLVGCSRRSCVSCSRTLERAERSSCFRAKDSSSWLPNTVSAKRRSKNSGRCFRSTVTCRAASSRTSRALASTSSSTTRQGAFGRDPYLAASAPRSVLAAPIVGKDRLAGVIYLENDLARSAFTPDRIEVLSLLSAQAAIAIENAHLYAHLERKVEARTAELKKANEEMRALSAAEERLREQEAVAQQELIAKQAQVIEALSTPFIEVWDHVLAVPIVGAVDDRRGEEIMQRLLERISGAGCRAVIIDVTGVEVVDTRTAELLVRIVQSVRLLGTSVAVTGIQPSVAQTLVQMVRTSRASSLGRRCVTR